MEIEGFEALSPVLHERIAMARFPSVCRSKFSIRCRPFVRFLVELCWRLPVLDFGGYDRNDAAVPAGHCAANPRSNAPVR